MYSPAVHSRIFGSSFVKHFVESPLLVIGKEHWSRSDMVALGVPNTVACGNLSSIVKKMGITSVKELFEKTSPYTFAEHRAGVVTLYVLFAVFNDKGFDPAKWYKRNEKDALVGFLHFKRRELEARAEQRKADRKRERQSRSTTHRHRVKSFLATAH